MSEFGVKNNYCDIDILSWLPNIQVTKLVEGGGGVFDMMVGMDKNSGFCHLSWKT